MITAAALISLSLSIILYHVNRLVQRREHFKRMALLMRGFLNPEEAGEV